MQRRSMFMKAQLLAGLLLLGGCGAPPDAALGTRRQAVCNPNNSGGDLGCACTDNPQCTGFDDDTRLVICDVPSGMTVGACLNCTAVSPRPVGCVCDSDAECQAGLRCNGRTCQSPRNRGELCRVDSDCGTDAMGAMTCLPTKHLCGPLPDDYFCDFNTDCQSGNCNGVGVCTSGGMDVLCTRDAECAPPLVCSTINSRCIAPQADGGPCTRNAECVNQCNSFAGRCLEGTEGIQCTLNGNLAGPNGDCVSGLLCTDCTGSFNCRPSGSICP